MISQRLNFDRHHISTPLERSAASSNSSSTQGSEDENQSDGLNQYLNSDTEHEGPDLNSAPSEITDSRSLLMLLDSTLLDLERLQEAVTEDCEIQNNRIQELDDRLQEQQRPLQRQISHIQELNHTIKIANILGYVTITLLGLNIAAIATICILGGATALTAALMGKIILLTFGIRYIASGLIGIIASIYRQTTSHI